MRSLASLAVAALVVLVVGGAVDMRTQAQTVPTLPTTFDGIPSQGGTVPPDMDLVRYGLQQGGLVLIILLGGMFYRRDFFRKNENLQGELDAERERSRLLSTVVQANTEASTRQAVAIQTNTEATNRLAASVDRFADRRAVAQA